MNTKWLLLCVLFVTTACQSFQNSNVQSTRIILFLTNGINSSQIEPTLHKLSQQLNIEKISLIRQSNEKQLIVNVFSYKPKEQWLEQLIAIKQVEYAEVDVKKMAK